MKLPSCQYQDEEVKVVSVHFNYGKMNIQDINHDLLFVDINETTFLEQYKLGRQPEPFILMVETPKEEYTIEHCLGTRDIMLEFYDKYDNDIDDIWYNEVTRMDNSIKFKIIKTTLDSPIPPVVKIIVRPY